MIKNLYLALKKKIETDLAEIKGFLWLNGEYQDESQNEVWATPCVYFEVFPYKKNSKPKRYKDADITFRLHLVSEDFKDDPTEYLDLADRLFDCVEGFSPQRSYITGDASHTDLICNHITHSAIEPDHRQTNLIIHILEFQTVVYEWAAVKDITAVTPDLDVQTDIVASV